ncbi:hypothetical protein BST61_g9311 [Cercospora zeina]
MPPISPPPLTSTLKNPLSFRNNVNLTDPLLLASRVLASSRAIAITLGKAVCRRPLDVADALASGRLERSSSAETTPCPSSSGNTISI